MGESRNEPQDQGPRWKLLWFDEAGGALPDYEPPGPLDPPFVRLTRRIKALIALLTALLVLSGLAHAQGCEDRNALRNDLEGLREMLEER